MRWKWIPITFGLLLIVMLGAVYLILVNYDYNELKPRIAKMVRDATGRDLKLGGEVKLAFGFSPKLVVRDVSLRNAAWGSKPDMIKVGELQAQARLLPLLLGDVELEHIGLSGVDLLLETDSTGQGNWDFASDHRSSEKSGGFKVPRVDVASIRIENLRFAFRNGMTGSETRGSLAELDVANQETLDSLSLNLHAAYNGQPLTLAGKIGRIAVLLAGQRFPLELSGQFSNAAFEIAGAIQDVLHLNGIDFKVRVSGKNLWELGLIKGNQFPKTEAFEVEGHLKGSKDVLALEDFVGNLSGGGIDLTINGRVGDLVAADHMDLRLKTSGKNLAALGPPFDVKLPETDQFTGQGRLTGSAKTLSLQDAQGSAHKGSLRIDLKGGIKDLVALAGMDLQVKVSGTELAEVGPLLDTKIPELGPFDVSGRLTGSAKTLSLQDAQGSAHKGSLRIDLKGGIKDLIALAGMDLQVKVSGTELAEVGPLLDTKIPELGPFDVSGRLTGSAKTLSLQDGLGSAHKGSLRIDLKGGIKDLIALAGMDLQVKVSGTELAEVGPLLDTKIPDLGPFDVSGRLTGSAKTLSLQDGQGSAHKGSLRIDLKGGIKDLVALAGMDLQVKVSGTELAEVGPLLDTKMPDLGPFDVSGRLTGSKSSLSFDGLSAIIDQSDFNGHGTVALQKRPKITLVLESSVMDFTRIMKSLEGEKQVPSQEGKDESRLFSDEPIPFAFLRHLDADIVLKARNIHARDARFKLGHVTLKLDDARLDVDTLEATYLESKLSGNFHLDSRSESHLSTEFLVQNLDVGNCLKEMGVSDQLQGNVDIAVNIESKGNSVHALMANLNGKVGAVMGKGYMPRFLDLLAMNLSQRVNSFWGKHKEAGHIKCAVVDFDIKSGVATSEAFVFDTKLAILGGEGDINLGTEQVNFLLVPKPKRPSLVSLATNLRVSGSMADPKVRPDTVSLLTTGAKFLSVLAIGPLGLLVPFVNLGANQKHPCDILSTEKLKQLVPADP